MQWQRAHNDQNHGLHAQVKVYPYSSAIGLLTSRREGEWTDNHTNSSDLIFLGAIPRTLGEATQEYCTKAMKRVGKHHREICQTKCKELSDQWRKVEVFTRAKPIIVQKAISAQLQEYKKEMKKIEKENENEERNSEEEEESPNEPETDPAPNSNKVVTIRTCIGKKCFLTQTPKQFKSVGTLTKEGPKKCSVCPPFESALNKCLAVEKYIGAAVKRALWSTIYSLVDVYLFSIVLVLKL